MPKGPKGEKRPADVIGAAVMVMKIGTGEISESRKSDRGRAGGKRGGPARAEKLTPKQRSRIAKKAAESRWNGRREPKKNIP